MDPLMQLSLPPGFRFFPTDEELLVQYLCRKVAGHHFNLQLIAEIDLYKFDPWVLPGKIQKLNRTEPNPNRPSFLFYDCKIKETCDLLLQGKLYSGKKNGTSSAQETVNIQTGLDRTGLPARVTGRLPVRTK